MGNYRVLIAGHNSWCSTYHRVLKCVYCRSQFTTLCITGHRALERGYKLNVMGYSRAYYRSQVTVQYIFTGFTTQVIEYWWLVVQVIVLYITGHGIQKRVHYRLWGHYAP